MAFRFWYSVPVGTHATKLKISQCPADLSKRCSLTWWHTVQRHVTVYTDRGVFRKHTWLCLHMLTHTQSLIQFRCLTFLCICRLSLLSGLTSLCTACYRNELFYSHQTALSPPTLPLIDFYTGPVFKKWWALVQNGRGLRALGWCFMKLQKG